MSVSLSYQHIADDLLSYGLELKTAAWFKSQETEELKEALRLIGHSTDASATIYLDTDFAALMPFLTDTPDEASDVAVLVVESDTNVIVGYFQFLLCSNASDEERVVDDLEDFGIPAFELDEGDVWLGLKWVKGEYRASLARFGTDENPYSINMALTEVGFCIMEHEGRHQRAITFYATDAGQSSGQNSGMDEDGRLILASRLDWTSKTEAFAATVAEKGWS